MLMIPALRRIGSLTAYQDDAIWTRFYLTPSVPRVRRDAEGRPVFLLAVYHVSDQERAADPKLPRGGGYMSFDAEFAADVQELEAARVELQAWVDEEYVRRRADPALAALPEYQLPEAPTVQIADPTLSSGTVTMHTTQSELLISERLADAPASIVGNAAATFNADLTPLGASFMKDLMTTPAGTGRIDLTPVQVRYAMKMWARLPPVAITVKADSSRVHQTLRSISETHGDNICTPFQVETYREQGVNSATLTETGVVEVKIDKGDATVPDEVLESLQNYALEMFDTMIEERFLVPAEGEEEPLELPDEGRRQTTTPGRLHSRSFRLRPNTRYKVRETINTATMHLEIKIDRSQVVEWPVGGQATLETFFAGASAQDISRHVVDVFPDDFNTLGVTARAHVDFEKSPVQAVELQTEYSAKDARGETHVTPGGHTFVADEAGAWKFDPTVIEAQRDYRFRYKVIYDDGVSSDYTEWETSSSPAINIAVADPAVLRIDLSAATMNWDLVRSVRVVLTYGTPEPGSPHLEQSYELTKLNPARVCERQFGKALQGEVKAQLTYFLEDGKVMPGETQMIAVTDSLFIVPPPQLDMLNVTLMPTGDWSDVAQAIVSMEYDAGEGRIHDKTFRFTSLDQMAEWAVALRDPQRRNFRYRTVTAYKNGQSDQSDWKPATGDQTIAIHVPGTPKLKINFYTATVDFARTPIATVTVTYGSEIRTLSFTAKSAASFEAALSPDGSREFIYAVAWHTPEGTEIRRDPERTSQTEINIPPAKLAAPGKLEVLVRGFAVDYAVTPFVDVQIDWTDGDLKESKIVTLAKDATRADWSVPIPDRTKRKYRYAITYNLADGTRIPGASGDTEDPIVSVTRYQA
jgi:hypothetical protein